MNDDHFVDHSYYDPSDIGPCTNDLGLRDHETVINVEENVVLGDVISKHEKEYQSQWLFNMMTDPKIEALKYEIEARGGSMGFFNVSLIWDNTDDLDLIVKCPCCPEIYYGDKRSKCGGMLDMDANSSKFTQVPIENVFWEDLPPDGKYTITVSNYNGRNTNANGDKTSFRCLIRYKDVIKAFDGKVGHKEVVTVFDDLINFF